MSKHLSMAEWRLRVPTTDNTNAAYIFRGDRSKPDFYIANNGFEDKARRVVACLNACRGLPTDELEKSGLVSTVGTQLIELEKQRDQLLAALEHVMRCIPLGGFAQIHHNSDTWRQIDEAITAAKGGAA